MREALEVKAFFEAGKIFAAVGAPWTGAFRKILRPHLIDCSEYLLLPMVSRANLLINDGLLQLRVVLT
jgi:hypothetical protein